MPEPTHFGLHRLLRSRTGLVLAAFLVIAAILVGGEHRLHVIQGLVLLLLSAVCLGMHWPQRHGGGGKGGEKGENGEGRAEGDR